MKELQPVQVEPNTNPHAKLDKVILQYVLVASINEDLIVADVVEIDDRVLGVVPRPMTAEDEKKVIETLEKHMEACRLQRIRTQYSETTATIIESMQQNVEEDEKTLWQDLLSYHMSSQD